MASYKHALEWIASNDDTYFLNSDDVIPSVTLCLVADIFNKPLDKAIKDLRKAVTTFYKGSAA